MDGVLMFEGEFARPGIVNRRQSGFGSCLSGRTSNSDQTTTSGRFLFETPKRRAVSSAQRCWSRNARFQRWRRASPRSGNTSTSSPSMTMESGRASRVSASDQSCAQRIFPTIFCDTWSVFGPLLKDRVSHVDHRCGDFDFYGRLGYATFSTLLRTRDADGAEP